MQRTEWENISSYLATGYEGGLMPTQERESVPENCRKGGKCAGTQGVMDSEAALKKLWK